MRFFHSRGVSGVGSVSEMRKLTQRQRAGQSPGYAALAVDALEISNQQQPGMDPRNQAGTAHRRRIELPAIPFHECVEFLLIQLIQPLIERMTRRPRQLCVRNPNLFLLLLRLPRSYPCV